MHWNCSFLFLVRLWTRLLWISYQTLRADIKNPFLWHFCLMSHDKNTLVLDKLATKLKMMTSHYYLGSFVLSTLADKRSPRLLFIVSLWNMLKVERGVDFICFLLPKCQRCLPFVLSWSLKRNTKTLASYVTVVTWVT